MGKVFAQLKPLYSDKITLIEVDISIKENNPLIDKYQVLTIPTSVLVDNMGSVKEKDTGFISAHDMLAKLDKLILKP